MQQTKATTPNSGHIITVELYRANQYCDRGQGTNHIYSRQKGQKHTKVKDEYGLEEQVEKSVLIDCPSKFQNIN